MTESKKKIPLTGVVKIPDMIAQELDIEAARLGVFKYEVVLRAWEAYKVANRDSPKELPISSVLSDSTRDNVGSPSSTPVLDRLPGGSPWVEDLIAILQSGHRAAELSIKLHLSVLREFVDVLYERDHPANATGGDEAEIRRIADEKRRVIEDANRIIGRADKLVGRAGEGGSGEDPVQRRNPRRTKRTG